MDKFNSPEYIRSRRSYIAQATIEYFIGLLVTDVYLAKLLSSIGISDAMIGIISSIVTLAFVFQVLTLLVTNTNTSSKKMVMIFDTISILCFMLVYLVPFFPISKTGKTILLIALILSAYFCKYLILNICFKWANEYVEPTKRASFSASKEMVSLFTGMIFTAGMGYILDVFESADNLSGGFLFLAASILILNISNFISLLLIKKDTPSKKTCNREPLSHILANLLKNKNFRSVVIITVLWDVARYFTIGFLGVFKSKDLMMSVFLVQIVNIIANTARLMVSKPIGKYSDKTSFSRGFKLGLYLAAAAFFINIFTTNATWFFIIIYTVLYSCAYAGTSANSFNMVYNYVDSKYIVQAMAIKNCIGGLCGFTASILGGKILDLIQANNNMIFGVHIYGQQVLSAISFVITLIAVIYIAKVLEKERIIVQ